ncbi:MAG: flagellar biosynthetic protein FliR [Polyangiaceae bacterium]
MTLASEAPTVAAFFALSVTRLSGFVATSPFPGSRVGPTARTTLVVALSAVVALAPETRSLPVSLPGFVASAALELGVGVAMGFAFRLLVVAGEVLGSTLSQASGLSTPTMLDPNLDSEETALTHFVTLVSMLLLLSVGGHRVALAHVLASFHSIPLGSTPRASAGVVGVFRTFGDSFAEGVRFGSPVLAVNLVVQSALAMVARAAPSLQIFNVGLSLLVLVGIATSLATLDAVTRGMISHFLSLDVRMDAVVDSFVATPH